nr:MAG TPA: hypothetical protein [Caudoviricetes sp.]
MIGEDSEISLSNIGIIYGHTYSFVCHDYYIIFGTPRQ